MYLSTDSKKVCYSCGWYWEGEPEEIIRQPFGGNSHIFEKGSLFYPDNKYTLIGSKYDDEIVSSDDACCVINNMNECVFTATKDWLKTNAISYEKIAEAVERTKKYKDLKQGF